MLSPRRGAPNPRSSSPTRAARSGRPSTIAVAVAMRAFGLLVRAGAPRRSQASSWRARLRRTSAPGRRPAPRARRAPRGSRRSRPRGRSPARGRAPGSASSTRSSTWRSWDTSTSPPRCTARRSSSQAMASMSRWFVGSSRISSTSSPASPGGPTSTRARARATRLVSPPDSVAVGSSRRPPRSRRSRVAAASHVRPVTSPIVAPGERRVLIEHDDARAAAPTDDAGLGLDAPGELAQQRRLAAAVEPDDGEAVAGLERDGHVREQRPPGPARRQRRRRRGGSRRPAARSSVHTGRLRTSGGRRRLDRGPAELVNSVAKCP